MLIPRPVYGEEARRSSCSVVRTTSDNLVKRPRFPGGVSCFLPADSGSRRKGSPWREPWTDMILSVGMERPRMWGHRGGRRVFPRTPPCPSLYGLAEMAVAEDAYRLLAVRCGSI